MPGVLRNEAGSALVASRTALRALMLGAVMACTLPSSQAFAQFSFFSNDVSAQDVYDTIADHGFRLAGPLVRNGNVYVADVIDRGRRRERLIISARNAQIVQRFFVDVSGSGRRGPYADPPPARTARNSDDDEGFFSRLTRGWGDDSPPRPPASIDSGLPSEAVVPRTSPRRVVRPKSNDVEPRLATRKDDAPVTASPLPAPAPAPQASPVQTLAPPAAAQPAPTVTATAPQPPAATSVPSAPASSTTRPVVVVTDPLRIPGERPKDAPKPAAEAAATKPAPAVKPSAKPADVPVAPLD